jgi:hypothetical protein
MPVKIGSRVPRASTVADDPAALETLPYEVGKNKPPMHSRFKPGHKGGPGRPKGAKNRATLLREALETPQAVVIGGKKRRMTPTQLGYQQLAVKVAKGDLKALLVAEQLRDRLIGGDETVVVEAPLTEAELAILARRRG